ncbi:hypothetical protein Tco_0276119 [Tanacetum coccineum]
MGASSRCSILHTHLLLVREKMRILALEVIFSILCELRASPRVPTNLNYGNTDLFKLIHLTVYDFYRFFYKVQFVVELNFFKRDNQILIRQTLLEIRNMEGVMNYMEFIGKTRLKANVDLNYYRNQSRMLATYLLKFESFFHSDQPSLVGYQPLHWLYRDDSGSHNHSRTRVQSIDIASY